MLSAIPLLKRVKDEFHTGPVQFIANLKGVSEIVAYLVTLVSSGFAISAATSSSSASVLSPLLRQFPFKLVLFAIAATGIGWAIAALGSRVARGMNEWGMFVSYFIAFTVAGVLVTLASLFFGQYGGSDSVSAGLFTLFGLCLACALANTEYQMFNANDVRQLQFKTSLLAIFAGSTSVLVIVAHLIELLT